MAKKNAAAAAKKKVDAKKDKAPAKNGSAKKKTDDKTATTKKKTIEKCSAPSLCNGRLKLQQDDKKSASPATWQHLTPAVALSMSALTVGDRVSEVYFDGRTKLGTTQRFSTGTAKLLAKGTRYAVFLVGKSAKHNGASYAEWAHCVYLESMKSIRSDESYAMVAVADDDTGKQIVRGRFGPVGHGMIAVDERFVRAIVPAAN